jgi:hypothetical protein
MDDTKNGLDNKNDWRTLKAIIYCNPSLPDKIENLINANIAIIVLCCCV